MIGVEAGRALGASGGYVCGRRALIEYLVNRARSFIYTGREMMLDEVLQRMRKAQEKGKEAALAEGVAIARDMFTRVKQMVQGVQVSAPFGRVEVALQVFA